MDGRSGAEGTGGIRRLWAGIEGSRGGRGMAYDGGRTGAGTSKAGQTDGQADGLADGPNRAKIARWLVTFISSLS